MVYNKKIKSVIKSYIKMIATMVKNKGSELYK